MSNRRLALAASVLLLAATPVHAIYKCTDEQGKMSFQDQPCNPAASESIMEAPKASRGTPEFKLVEIPLDGRATFVAGLPKSWRSTLKPPTSAPTLRATPERPDNLVLLVSFIPIRDDSISEARIISESMAALSRKNTGPSMRKVSEIDFDLVLMEGQWKLATFIDEALARDPNRPAGEFPVMMAAMLVAQRTLISATILTDDIESASTAAALAALATLVYEKDGG